jgi:hypothetical protein
MIKRCHPGHTLKKVEAPDCTKTHLPPLHCDACGAFVTEPKVVEDGESWPSMRWGFSLVSWVRSSTPAGNLTAICSVCTGSAMRITCEN